MDVNRIISIINMFLCMLSSSIKYFCLLFHSDHLKVCHEGEPLATCVFVKTKDGNDGPDLP